ncbi:fibrinogen-like protein 1 [Octopus bimaculoides]|nr:fibrinogen-like protein 1 [Octopus bimaculoides]|eukprot:XP_014773316.1 PREDICTED: fibrinogen-like protein 1 [Octopus bimaculoides]
MTFGDIFHQKLQITLLVFCLCLVKAKNYTKQTTIRTESCSYTIVVNRRSAPLCPILTPSNKTNVNKSFADKRTDDEDEVFNEPGINPESGDYFFDVEATSSETSTTNDKSSGVCRRRLAFLTQRLQYLQEMQKVERERANLYESNVKGHDMEIDHIDTGLNTLKTNLTQLIRALHSMETKVFRQERINNNLHHKLSSVVLDMDEVSKNFQIRPSKPISHLTDGSGKKILSKYATPCSLVETAQHSYSDCSAIYKAGHKASGVYKIQPDGLTCSLAVWCDMDTDGGGWLLFQRRADGTENFNRKWLDYKTGFGDVSNEFWLGNQNIFLLSNQKAYELRIDLWDFSGNRAYATYQSFKIEGERDKYRLHVSSFSGTARNSFYLHNYAFFSTMDRDNDKHARVNCASQWDGGWWFTNCWRAMLNGLYHRKSYAKFRGIAWNSWKYEQLKATEMKIRPLDH